MELDQIASNFKIAGQITQIAPLGNGHINQTFLVNTDQEKYVLQEINASVFKHPEDVIQNFEVVTNHIHKNQTSAKTPKLVRTIQENSHFTVDNEFWRMSTFLDHSLTIEEVITTDLAFTAAKAFGNFLVDIKDLSLDEIKVTIPGFLDFRNRLAEFEEVVKSCDKELRSNCSAQIELARKYSIWAEKYEVAVSELPKRICHLDTKINNILFDDRDLTPLCVIDLDTMMPGSVLYDYGDMVRSFTNSAAEDDPNLDVVFCNKNILNSLTDGFKKGAAEILTPEEIKCLPIGGAAVIYVQGLRFLTDHLSGNKYYKSSYPEHNLIRARNQFKLLESYIEKADMSGIPSF